MRSDCKEPPRILALSLFLFQMLLFDLYCIGMSAHKGICLSLSFIIKHIIMFFFKSWRGRWSDGQGIRGLSWAMPSKKKSKDRWWLWVCIRIQAMEQQAASQSHPGRCRWEVCDWRYTWKYALLNRQDNVWTRKYEGRLHYNITTFHTYYNHTHKRWKYNEEYPR